MEQISHKQNELSRHPVYGTLTTLPGLQHFMSHHVFAVWDFMSLLKSLQIKLTCVSLPWMPSPYPTEVVRLINQIVLGEESDVDREGNPVSHFELYLKAMEEVGADTKPIHKFLKSQDMNDVPGPAREFVKENIRVAQTGHVVEVAASFFFGREKLIPDMFTSMVSLLKKENVAAPTFIYYLERHIEVDAEEHGPLALKALSHLTGTDSQLQILAETAGLAALKQRSEFWDRVLASNS